MTVLKNGYNPKLAGYLWNVIMRGRSRRNSSCCAGGTAPAKVVHAMRRAYRNQSHYEEVSSSSTLQQSWKGEKPDSTELDIGTTTTTIITTTTTTTTTSSSISSNASKLRHPILSPCNSCRVIDVSPLAESMRCRVRSYTKSLSDSNDEIRMVGILAEEGPYRHDAEIYSERIAETFAEDGIEYELLRCSGKSRDDVEYAIRAMNNRRDVHGILVFYPIFRNRVKVANKKYICHTGTYYKTDDDYLRDLVHSSKDVEGLRQSRYARSMFRARSTQGRDPDEVYVPCTALAVTRILDAFALGQTPYSSTSSPGEVCHMQDKKWSGSTITIINRSEILGRPLAALLALQGATVYSVDENSILFFGNGTMRQCSHSTTDDCLLQSSVIVTGVPTPDFSLSIDLVQEGATLVNVSEFENVDETALFERGIRVNYVPHVGKVTVAALEENLVRLHQQARSQSK